MSSVIDPADDACRAFEAIQCGSVAILPNDIEPEIKVVADLVIDDGLMKYHLWQASSTLLNCETCEVLRFGACYHNIADILRRHFNVTLPPPPA